MNFDFLEKVIMTVARKPYTSLSGCLAVLALASATQAHAANAVAPLPVSAAAQPETGTVIYDQAFFANSGVQNAEDMLRRLPGVQPLLDASQAGATTQSRGLGDGGDQILIDGKRLSDKGQLLVYLRRIAPATIDHIELIRGTSDKIKVQSEGLMVNIVLKPDAAKGKGVGSYEAALHWDSRGWFDWDGLISYSGKAGPVAFVVGAERNVWTPIGVTPSSSGAGDYTNKFHQEIYYYANGAVQQVRPQYWRRDHGKQIYTAALTYDFGDGDQLRLNALYQPLPIQQIDSANYTSYSPTGAVTEVGDDYHQNNQTSHTYDFGGELEKTIGKGTLNVIVIHTRKDQSADDYRNHYLNTGVTVPVSRSSTTQTTGEDIVRASVSWPIVMGQTLTVGAEGARNTLDQHLTSFVPVANILTPVNLGDTAHTGVQESRGEAFVIDDWKITSKLTLQASLSFEASRITTDFPLIPVHDYKFPKPRLDLRYQVTPLDRLRLKLDRVVSQLNFTNFVPVYNQIDNRIDAGNPQIAPERDWIYEADWEHRLAGDNGAVEARFYYNSIAGTIDRGPGGVDSLGVPFSEPINIDHASRYGLELKASVRLAALHARNVQVTTRFLQQHSSVIDPFTGKERTLVTDYKNEFNIGFRHDLQHLKLSYGVDMIATSGPLITSDIRNLNIYYRGPRYDLFIEKALPHGLTLRLEGYNLTGSHESQKRYIYGVSQTQGTVSQVQYYAESRDRRWVLRLRGKF